MLEKIWFGFLALVLVALTLAVANTDFPVYVEEVSVLGKKIIPIPGRMPIPGYVLVISSSKMGEMTVNVSQTMYKECTKGDGLLVQYEAAQLFGLFGRVGDLRVKSACAKPDKPLF